MRALRSPAEAAAPRIALVTPGFSASDEDWCIPALAHLVRAVSGRVEIMVLALRYPHATTPYRAFGAEVHPLGFRRGGVARLLLLARASARVVREGRGRRFAAVHGLWADEAGAVATRAAAALRVPAVVSVMGGELACLPEIGYGTQLGLAGRVLVRRSLARADLVTVGSRALALRAAPLVPPGRLRELPLGVDCAMFAPAGETAALTGRPALLHVGSLTSVKDQRTLLSAFARVAAAWPEAQLHLVGDGPARGELERLAGALGVAARVRFRGPVPHDRLAPYYRAADLVVTSSRFESQGMVPVEAAACGTATVGTATGVLPELLPELAHARPGDADGLAAAVLEALADRERLRALTAAGLATVRRRFTLAGTVDALVGLWEEAAVARGRP